MEQYIALLRGINVGGHGIIAMRELVEIFNKLGAFDVKTYIQSGNIVFNATQSLVKNLDTTLSVAIKHEKGFAPSVLIFSTDYLQRVIEHNPFPTNEGKALYCYFLFDTPKDDGAEEIAFLKTKTEQTSLKDRIFYLYAPEGIGRSKLASKVEKILGVQASARNWNTIMKLAEMTESRSG